MAWVRVGAGWVRGVRGAREAEEEGAFLLRRGRGRVRLSACKLDLRDLTLACLAQRRLEFQPGLEARQGFHEELAAFRELGLKQRCRRLDRDHHRTAPGQLGDERRLHLDGHRAILRQLGREEGLRRADLFIVAVTRGHLLQLAALHNEA